MLQRPRLRTVTYLWTGVLIRVPPVIFVMTPPNLFP
jgi:hypothetical protein